MRRIRITATHGRSGWTRYAGTTLDVVEEGPSTEKAVSAHDATQCAADGQGEWDKPAAEATEDPPAPAPAAGRAEKPK